jgi:hypothetical protein
MAHHTTANWHVKKSTTITKLPYNDKEQDDEMLPWQTHSLLLRQAYSGPSKKMPSDFIDKMVRPLNVSFPEKRNKLRNSIGSTGINQLGARHYHPTCSNYLTKQHLGNNQLQHSDCTSHLICLEDVTKLLFRTIIKQMMILDSRGQHLPQTN